MPPRSEEKAIRVPSGDQAGSRSSPAESVKRSGAGRADGVGSASFGADGSAAAAFGAAPSGASGLSGASGVSGGRVSAQRSQVPLR